MDSSLTHMQISPESANLLSKPEHLLQQPGSEIRYRFIADARTDQTIMQKYWELLKCKTRTKTNGISKLKLPVLQYFVILAPSNF